MSMFDNFKNLFSSNNNSENDDLFPDTLDEKEIDEEMFDDDVLISAKVDVSGKLYHSLHY